MQLAIICHIYEQHWNLSRVIGVSLCCITTCLTKNKNIHVSLGSPFPSSSCSEINEMTMLIRFVCRIGHWRGLTLLSASSRWCSIAEISLEYSAESQWSAGAGCRVGEFTALIHIGYFFLPNMCTFLTQYRIQNSNPWWEPLASKLE